MPLLRNVQLARKLATNILRSRKTRAALQQRSAELALPAPASISIAVYFADTRVNLYQIRQWYAPLAELSKIWPVAIIVRSPGTMLTLLDESPVLPVYLRRVVDLEQFVHEQDIKIVFYVNQNSKNFQMFRYGRLWHVFINHGESDKMYMTTNQFKAYDYSFVAGQAALDRLTKKLWDFDVEKKAIPIGRPQADHFAGAVPYPIDDRVVVLYAPTWEGDRAAAAYGSIASHGETIARAILASDRHRFIYRPHPRSGVVNAEYGAANRRIIEAIAAANAKDPDAYHIFDDGPEMGWQISAADVAITDISAMVYDRLATGRPVVVTRPASDGAEIDEGGFLGDCDWLTADGAADIIGVVDRSLTNPDAQARLAFWAQNHFGDTTPGAATARFHAAVAMLVERWNAHAAVHAGDRVESESDPLDDEDTESVPGE